MQPFNTSFRPSAPITDLCSQVLPFYGLGIEAILMEGVTFLLADFIIALFLVSFFYPFYHIPLPSSLTYHLLFLSFVEVSRQGGIG